MGVSTHLPQVNAHEAYGIARREEEGEIEEKPRRV